MDHEGSHGLGSWDPSELTITAHAQAGIGVDNDLPASTRFFSSIVKLVRRRRVQPDAKLDPQYPAIFLLKPTPPSMPSGDIPKRVPMLDNGLTVLNRRIWFVNEVTASGRYIDYDATDDDQLFAFVHETLGLETIPAILFDPRVSGSELRFYPNGIGDTNNVLLDSVGTEPVTLEQIFEVIGQVYSSCLITPESQPKGRKLWHNQDKWQPLENAELLVQADLKAGLAGAFRACEIREEYTMPEGRLDLLIEERGAIDRGEVTLHAVLELKVLRSYRQSGRSISDNWTRNWIESGVKQAATYRTSKGARDCALCCFDMRRDDTGDDCFDHVRDLADHFSVKMKRWYLYASSTHLRDALTSSA